MDTWIDIEREKQMEYRQELLDICTECAWHDTDDCPWDGKVFLCMEAGDGPFLYEE